MTVGMSLSLLVWVEGVSSCTTLSFPDFPTAVVTFHWVSVMVQICRSWSVKLESKEASHTQNFTSLNMSIPFSAMPPKCSEAILKVAACCLFLSAAASLLVLSLGVRVMLELKGVWVTQGTGYKVWLGEVGIWSDNPWGQWMTWIMSVWWLQYST